MTKEVQLEFDFTVDSYIIEKNKQETQGYPFLGDKYGDAYYYRD